MKFGGNQSGNIIGTRTIGNSSISINNMWLVDGLEHNLLSISHFCDNGYDVMFGKTNYTVIDKDDNSIVFKGKRVENVYKINFSELVDQKVICLLSMNDKKWVCDESIISCFNMIFGFVLFRFKFILFKYYFLLDLFYFNCIFIFQERIFDRFSFGAKERGLGNTRFSTKIYHSPSHKLGTARAISHTVVPHPRILFCCFLLLVQATY